MAQWLEAFGLGSAAILTNACLLPLYPGLIAFMAGTADAGRPRRVTGVLGVFVLLGVLVMMVLIGLVVLALRQTMGSLLQYLLPLIYGVVIVFGVLLLLDRSPFARFATLQTPLLRNPYAAAFVYGLLLGPMTLPCTGPIITSAFVLGAGDAGMLADGLLYFLFFGLGFGWPLVLLPLLALPLQKRLVGWLARNHTMLNRASGVLLVAVGVFGIVTELLPQYVAQLTITSTFWAVYWAAVGGLVLLVAVLSSRKAR